jgi:hypothetical protein
MVIEELIGRTSNWKYSHGVCLEGLMKSTKDLKVLCLRAEILTRDILNTKQVRVYLDFEVRLVELMNRSPY